MAKALSRVSQAGGSAVKFVSCLCGARPPSLAFTQDRFQNECSVELDLAITQHGVHLSQALNMTQCNWR